MRGRGETTAPHLAVVLNWDMDEVGKAKDSRLQSAASLLAVYSLLSSALVGPIPRNVSKLGATMVRPTVLS